MSERHWSLVETLHDPIQAEILRGLLEAQDFTVHIVREGYQAAYGLANQPSIKIELMVPNDQVAAAKQVLDDYYSGKFEEGS